jgi:enamine deaminase RidA (YjgF/YER057c/UK114 family)
MFRLADLLPWPALPLVGGAAKIDASEIGPGKASASSEERVDHIDRLYPTGRGFSQVVIATGQRQIFISGQVAVNENGEVVGKGDLGAQTEQVLRNIDRGLREANATFEDVVRMTVYVVEYDPSKRDQIQTVRDRFIPPDAGPASTLVGVGALVSDEFLVEIEVQAITVE